MAAADREIANRTRPFADASLPGVKDRVTGHVFAAVGPLVAPFPSSTALATRRGAAPATKPVAANGRPTGPHWAITFRSALVETARTICRSNTDSCRLSRLEPKRVALESTGLNRVAVRKP